MIHTIALLLFAVVPAETATWPAFLGAGAQSTAQPLPLQWSPAKNIAWRSELPGHGQSSPVVWGPRLFVTSVSGEQKDTYHILCLDLLDGRELWRRSLANSAPQ
ncbi:MAG: PQQ-binding-like beta-propeller repeat protein [Planctomycetales bacterium]|nr:PQQ-binding-like beta-propeller repeat protein [Planctomycetales bacterium]